MAAGLSACAGSTSGTAVPQPTASATQQPSNTDTGTTSTTASKPSSPVADADPCTLLPQSLKTQLKLGSERKNDLGGARGCRWDDADSTFTVDIGIRDTQGIGEFDTSHGAVTDTTIGGHSAKLQRSVTGSCV